MHARARARVQLSDRSPTLCNKLSYICTRRPLTGHRQQTTLVQICLLVMSFVDFIIFTIIIDLLSLVLLNFTLVLRVVIDVSHIKPMIWQRECEYATKALLSKSLSD